MQKDEVLKVAKLAALEIEEKDIESITQDMTNILALVDQMQEIDTQGVEPMSHPQDAVQRLRSDQVLASNVREDAQKIAPLTQDGLYLVPKVIE